MQKHIQQYIPDNAQAEYSGDAVMFEVSISDIQHVVGDLYNTHRLSLKLITATDEREESGCFKIWYVFGAAKEHTFIIPFIRLQDTTEFPSIESEIHEAANYERRIKTFFGLTPIGGHDARPIILHENWPTDVFPLRKDFAWNTRPTKAKGCYRFQKIKGEGIYEIPVGPIHAGIIEPGHFRFSVAGERIVNLEPRLGFTHKGSEKLFETLSLANAVQLSEQISGDSSFGHSLAFCQALEQLSDATVPARALYLRVIYAELERLANHFGDIGAMMLDTGFNFGGAQGARLREIIMQLHDSLTGNRFLRGVNIIGGVTKDIQDTDKDVLIAKLHDIQNDFSEVIAVAENSTSLLNRLKGTGELSAKAAKDNGVIGVAGRAVGMSNDARAQYPYAAYANLSFGEIVLENDGDVYARFRVRIREVYASIRIIQDALRQMPAGPVGASAQEITFKKNAVAIGVTEGWRGEIVYFVATDANGSISRVAPRDPSFVNWSALKDAGFDNVVPDFPLINKSFNLSYSGNDL